VKLRSCLGTLVLASACLYGPALNPQSSQTATAGWIEYSDMFVHPETGDILGTDLRLRKSGALYEIILFCGEGVPVGPVSATFALRGSSADISPSETLCGGKILLKLAPKGVNVKFESGKWEFIPRHKNFVREDRWK